MTYTTSIPVARLAVGDLLVPARALDRDRDRRFVPDEAAGATVTAVNTEPPRPGSGPAWSVQVDRVVGWTDRPDWPPHWWASVERAGEDPDPPAPDPDFTHLDVLPRDLRPGDRYWDGVQTATVAGVTIRQVEVTRSDTYHPVQLLPADVPVNVTRPRRLPDPGTPGPGPGRPAPPISPDRGGRRADR